jgi:hypothetical protein
MISELSDPYGFFEPQNYHMIFELPELPGEVGVEERIEDGVGTG